MRTLTEELGLGTPVDSTQATKVIVVDDHQAVRLGIQMLLDDEPGVEVVASGGSYEEGLDAAAHLEPDIAVVDYQLPERDGLTLTRKLVTMPSPPRVLVFSAYADERLEIAALLAGAHAVLGKNSLGVELCHRILALARGERPQFSISAQALAVVGEELEVEDRPILGMLAAGTEPGEIARLLGFSESELDARRSAMLRRLKTPPKPPDGT